MLGEGIVISINKYSEGSFIIKIFSKEHGKITSFLKRNASKKSDKLALGNLIKFNIKKRLEEHMGVLNFETIKPYSAYFIKDQCRLNIFSSIIEALFFLTAEGIPEEEIYTNCIELLESLIAQACKEDLIKQYLLFEVKLLANLGFGLDLTECALTKRSCNLYFLSPATGRACSFDSGKVFKDKLFEIPMIFGNNDSTNNLKDDFINAFKITTHFLKKIQNFEKLFSRNLILKH